MSDQSLYSPSDDSSQDSPVNQSSEPSQQPPTYRSLREQRRAERWARREARWEQRAGRPGFWWVGGAFLVLLGVVILLDNMGVTTLKNWWALFILFPAYGTFTAAIASFQNHGRLTRGSVGSFVWGVLFTALTLVFLFNLDLGLYWPVLLIAGGVGLLITAVLPG